MSSQSSATERLPTVFVVNTSDDTVDMLRLAFERAGFVVVSALTSAVREGVFDLPAFVRLHAPDVIVYDIGLPYEANWRFFCHLRATESMREVPVVITTTNVSHVQPLAGEERVHEIVGKPYDLDRLIEIVGESLHTRGD
jgi:DNA-binding response OmpR family regulator